jgi:hypothetical protein
MNEVSINTEIKNTNVACAGLFAIVVAEPIVEIDLGERMPFQQAGVWSDFLHSN